MAERTPVLTWHRLAALRATRPNSSEPAAPFPGRFSGTDAPCATICMSKGHRTPSAIKHQAKPSPPCTTQ